MSAEAALQTEWFTIRRNAYAWSLVKLFDLQGVAALTCCVAVSIYETYARGPIPGLKAILAGVGIYATFTLYEYRNAWGRVEKRIEALETPRRFAFSEAGIRIEMKGKKSSLVSWQKIEKVEHRAGFTFLIFEKSRHYPIPDNAFPRKEQRREVEAMFRKRSTLTE